jgi:hypothetical protein
MLAILVISFFLDDREAIHLVDRKRESLNSECKEGRERGEIEDGEIEG